MKEGYPHNEYSKYEAYGKGDMAQFGVNKTKRLLVIDYNN